VLFPAATITIRCQRSADYAPPRDAAYFPVRGLMTGFCVFLISVCIDPPFI
jgi:hypothetical protein